jgi:ADP-heptose:LPS heptosyltransferase
VSAIVVAPFSNSDIRDWPTGHWAALIGLLLERWTEGGTIRVIGTRNQMLRAAEVVRAFDATRVVNMCGHMAWDAVLAQLRAAACVIGNNSGVAHLAGFYGVPTVCVFGGSHQRMEWRPLGFNVVTVSRVIGCSPCQLDHGQVSPYAKACLREIAPETVADAAFRIMERVKAMRMEGTMLDRSVPLPAREMAMQDGGRT